MPCHGISSTCCSGCRRGLSVWPLWHPGVADVYLFLHTSVCVAYNSLPYTRPQISSRGGPRILLQASQTVAVRTAHRLENGLSWKSCHGARQGLAAREKKTRGCRVKLLRVRALPQRGTVSRRGQSTPSGGHVIRTTATTRRQGDKATAGHSANKEEEVVPVDS